MRLPSPARGRIAKLQYPQSSIVTWLALTQSGNCLQVAADSLEAHSLTVSEYLAFKERTAGGWLRSLLSVCLGQHRIAARSSPAEVGGCPWL